LCDGTQIDAWKCFKDLCNIMTNLAMVTSQVFGIVIGNEVRLED